jgi:hypothetical protein
VKTLQRFFRSNGKSDVTDKYHLMKKLPEKQGE